MQSCSSPLSTVSSSCTLASLVHCTPTESDSRKRLKSAGSNSESQLLSNLRGKTLCFNRKRKALRTFSRITTLKISKLSVKRRRSLRWIRRGLSKKHPCRLITSCLKWPLKLWLRKMSCRLSCHPDVRIPRLLQSTNQFLLTSSGVLWMTTTVCRSRAVRSLKPRYTPYKTMVLTISSSRWTCRLNLIPKRKLIEFNRLSSTRKPEWPRQGKSRSSHPSLYCQGISRNSRQWPDKKLSRRHLSKSSSLSSLQERSRTSTSVKSLRASREKWQLSVQTLAASLTTRRSERWDRGRPRNLPRKHLKACLSWVRTVHRLLKAWVPPI